MLTQVLRLAGNLVLTRLLLPEMFGLMALANLVVLGLSLFSDLGLNQGVVRSRRGHEADYLNTVWTVQLLRGLLLAGGVLLVAAGVEFAAMMHWWPEGSVYADQRLPVLLAALALCPLIGGFDSTKFALAHRNMSQRTVTLIAIICQLGGLVVMVVWAWVDRSMWALVAGSIATNLLRASLGHVLLPGPANTLRWDKAAVAEIFGFGKWIFFSSILGFLAANGDRLILGGLTDSVQLGLYSIAFLMVNTFQDLLAKLLGTVAYPALSDVTRNRPHELKRVYYKFRFPLDAVALLACGGLMSGGHLIIEFLYDDRYHGAGAMLSLLAVALVAVRYTLADQCFMALGKSNLMAYVTGLRVLALFAFMPIAFHFWGLPGAVLVAGGYGLFALPLTLYFKKINGIMNWKYEVLVMMLIAPGYGLGWLLNIWF